MSKRSTMTTNFCFTAISKDYPFTKADLPTMVAALKQHKWWSYHCIGLEHQGKAPADWPKDKPFTAHFQGFVQTSQQARWAGFKNNCPGGKGWAKKRKEADKDGEWSEVKHWQAIHWENKHRGSSAAEARAYCMKEGDFIEEGVFVGSDGSGKRNDLVPIHEAVFEPGVTKAELAKRYPKQYMRMRGNIVAMLNDLHEAEYVKRDQLMVVVLWGATGLGKSEMALRWKGEEDTYLIHGFDFSMQWFPMYCGQTVLIIDDWTPAQCKLGKMLKLLDNKKACVAVKGYNVLMRWTTVFITTNKEWPNQIYTGVEQGRRDALFRRITQVHHITEHWSTRQPISFECREPTVELSDRGDISEGELVGYQDARESRIIPQKSSPSQPKIKPRLERQHGFLFDREEE